MVNNKLITSRERDQYTKAPMKQKQHMQSTHNENQK